MDTVKGKAIARDPRVALGFDDERPPFGFVSIRGTARVVDDLAQVRQWAARLGGRYMGGNRAEEYGTRNGVSGQVIVRVRPDKVVAMVDLAE